MSLFYIASPYSHPDPEVQHQRYLDVMQFVAWCLEAQGPTPVPFSPILYCHEMAKRFMLPTDFLFWRAFNRGIIRASVHMTILRLPGWDQSKGVRDEIDFAESSGMIHYYADPQADGSYILKLA